MQKAQLLLLAVWMAASVLVKEKMAMVQAMRLVRAKAGMTEGQSMWKCRPHQAGGSRPFGNDR